MSNILIADTPQVFVGLGTLTYTVPTTGIYNVRCTATELPPSGLTIVVNDNAAPVFTAPAVSPTQIALQFKAGFVFTAGHTVTIVLSSANAIDSELNNVKTSITLGTGL